MKTENAKLYICPFCAHLEADVDKKNQPYSEGTRDFYKCRECGTIYPRPRPNFDTNLTHFQTKELAKPFEDPLTPFSRFSPFVSVMKRCKKMKNIKVALDIGTYTGMLCHLLETLGIEAYGLEAQQQATEFAQSKGLKVYCGAFPSVPPELERKYDLISVNQCYYLFVDIKKCLNKIHDMLSEGGILFIKVTSANSYYFSEGHPYSLRFGDYGQSVPTVSSLTYCLENSGFKIEEISPWPDHYFCILFKIKQTESICRSYLNRTFNRIYGVFFLNKKKWLNCADRFIILARKI